LNRIAYVNGEFTPLQQARISILDRGFLFADGVYEVSAVIDGGLVDNAAHLARLERSLSEISLCSPAPLERIAEIQRDLILRNTLTEGLVYIQITRGPAERDFAFPRDPQPTLVMFTQEKNILESDLAKRGVSVKTVPDIRWTRRDIKSIALLAQVLAKQAAAVENCHEAWLVDDDGHVTEGSSSTAYIITSDKTLITRQNSNAILPGCTRRAVLELALRHKLLIEQRRFSVEEALNAAEAFMTSATAFVTPVIKIDGAPIGRGAPGPLTMELRKIYIEFALEQIRDN
jgi:D-alanine transaminase